jgi:hypothetical protein
VQEQRVAAVTAHHHTRSGASVSILSSVLNSERAIEVNIASLLGEPYENVIVLSNEFFEEVTAHPIPTDLEAVKLLSSAPAVLDLFVWLSYRCFTSKGTERIPIFGPFGLVQQLGAVEYARPRKFREKLHQWLKTIRLVWPECPAQITADGETLRINPIHSAVTQESRSECLD